MSESSRVLALSAAHLGSGRRIARGVVLAIFVVLATSETTKADSQQYSVVARVDAKTAGLRPDEVVVRIGNLSAPATAIKASPEIPRNIAIVIDAGPDQAKVLPREKDLAIALINELAGVGTSFTIVSACTSSKTQARTLDRSVAIEHIREITGDSGEKRDVAVYDAIASAIRQISGDSGFRVVIFIGEGNDGGSRMRHVELRGLAESSQIAFFAALVADHTLRGTKAILRYGWNLRELASDTAGIFLENPRTAKATRQLSESIQGLRLVALEMPSRQSGRYKISVSVPRRKRLRSQNAIRIP